METQLAEIIASLKSLAPPTRNVMIKDVAHVLGESIHKIIDTHNTSSLIFIFWLGRSRYVLKIESGNNNATSREISWYRTVSKDIRMGPKCIASSIRATHCFLLLEYIENVGTIDELVESDSVGGPQCAEWIQQALRLDDELFSNSNPI